MKKIILITSFFILINSVYSQISEYGVPLSLQDTTQKNEVITEFNFHLDVKEAISKAQNDSAFVIGIGEETDIDFFTNSNILQIDENKKIYLLKIHVSNAHAVGLEFSDFYIPKNCNLFIYNENKTQILGAYTENNNNLKKVFAIQPIEGETIILEFNQLDTIIEKPILKICRIKEYFNDPNNPKIVGACFEDVHCVSDLDIERSVIKWEFVDTEDGLTYVCSCALINQDVENNDIKPYLLTAKHCGKNAQLSTAIFYFNYQHQDCDSTGGTEMYTMVGATEIARDYYHDMFLIELNQFPPPDYNVYLSGWDRKKASNISQVTGIHHPHGDEKSIALGTRQKNINPYFWRVEWDLNNSPTAGGSSGSPLFDTENNRIIGWLSYGFSECSNLDGIDSYGKLRKAWTNTSADKRLHDWLDPNDNDNNFIDGRNPCFDYLLIENRTFFSAQEFYQPENKVVIQAANTIETKGNVVITSGSDYVFQAGETIILGPGFSTEEGCTFSAKIVPSLNNKNINKRKTDSLSIYKIELEDLNINTSLQQIRAFPNPFSEQSTIEYTISEETIVNIEIYDIQGNLKLILIDNLKHLEGVYQIDLNVNYLHKEYIFVF